MAEGDEADEADFFVSYTHADQPWARWISRVLEEMGYRVILQAWDFGAGSFIQQMELAVQRSKRLVPVLSDAYLRSRYARMEWAVYARDLAKIIPVQIEDIETRTLLGTNVRVNLRGLEEAAAVERLRNQMPQLSEPPSHTGRVRDPTATFPGSIPLVAPGSELVPEGVLPKQRIAVEPGRLQLVLLGTDSPTLSRLPTLFEVAPERVLDLCGSGLPPGEQLRLLAAALDGGPEPPTDVLVAFAGSGADVSEWGLRLDLKGTTSEPDTWLRLEAVLALLAQRARTSRSYVLLDAIDDQGKPVVPTGDTSVPLLSLRDRGDGAVTGRGLAGTLDLLDQDPVLLRSVLDHWAPLSLQDLATVSGGKLIAPEGWAEAIGLAPNPLGWPKDTPVVANWCAVISAADRRRSGDTVAHAVSQLEAYSRPRLTQALSRSDRNVELDVAAARCWADEVMSSPGSFARAVHDVCNAEIAVFDLTNYEPAVLVLLGIRAVIRRGVTLCVHGEHAEPWKEAEPPFHLREISMLPSTDFTRIERRLIAGIRQLGLPGRTYCDLPSFEPIRNVPPDRSQRGNRPFDRPPESTVLALVPFDASYEKTHWSELKANLPAAAMNFVGDLPDDANVDIRLVRTLDLDSPRVISSQLYEAIRLTDFCLVDLTAFRPNVLFELGVRLAASRLHPVVAVDAGYAISDADEESQRDTRAQGDQVGHLLGALSYTPFAKDAIEAYHQMVARHLELRQLDNLPEHPRVRTVLKGLPPSGVYDIAWPHAVDSDEVVTLTLEERLLATADALLIDPSEGAGHLVYPSLHLLTAAAERSGREYLVAAWLYLHYRRRAAASADSKLSANYDDLTARLLNLLQSSGDDDDATFATQVEAWRAEANSQVDPEGGAKP